MKEYKLVNNVIDEFPTREKTENNKYFCEFIDTRQGVKSYIFDLNGNHKKTLYFIYDESNTCGTLTTFPIYTFPDTFGKKRFPNLKFIRFVGFDLRANLNKKDLVMYSRNIIEDLPPPFVSELHHGFGVRKAYKIMIENLILKGFTKITILAKPDIKYTKKNDEFVISYEEFDKLRKLLDRIQLRKYKMHKTVNQFVVDTAYSDTKEQKIVMPEQMAKDIKLLLKYTRASNSAPLFYKEILDSVQNEVKTLVCKKKNKINQLQSEIEYVLLENILAEYKKLLDSDTKEERWHQFFKSNMSIISMAFNFPMIYFGDKAYVGGKGISNKGGHEADFLLKNICNGNLAILEIKTHMKSLLNNKKYRNGVYAPSEELSGGITQVLTQRYSLIVESNGLDIENASVINPPCFLVIGKLSDYNSDKEKKISFELFRSSIHGLQILAFDEVYEKLNNLYKALNIQRDEDTNTTP